MATNSKNFKVKNGIEVNGDSAIGGNVNLYNSSGYVQLKSSDGSLYNLTIENDGSLFTEDVTPFIEYLVIAGGGGGGANNSTSGGGGSGGGGGGLISGITKTFLFNTNYPILIGGGGVQGMPATNGNNSTFISSVAVGGGRGAAYFYNFMKISGDAEATSGGSGGGGRTPGQGIAGQGNSGGLSINVSGQAEAGGGGGGATGIGGNAQGHEGGKGGAGFDTEITGLSVGYAGGGGGSCGYCNIVSAESGMATHGGGKGSGTGVSGTVNRGGGGGGGNSGGGGAGGSGIVILKYPALITATFSVGVTQSTSTSGGYKISQITATSTTSETVVFS